MADLSYLGREGLFRPIAVYQGRVKLFSRKEEAAGEFTALQSPDATIQLWCRLEVSLMQEPTKVAGTTDDGYFLSANVYPFVPLRSAGEYTCQLLAKELRVKTSDLGASTHRLRFSFTNLELPRNKILFHVGGYEVVIKRVPEYQERLQMIKGLKGIAVVSEAVVDVSSIDEVPEVCGLMDDLSILFSLARGVKIDWICYEALSEQDGCIERYHRCVVVKPYSGFPLISENNLKAFIEETYPFLHKLKDHWIKSCCQEEQNPWWYQQAVDALADAKLEQDFLELRGLKLAALLDFISGIYLKDKNSEHIAPEENFESKRADLEKEMLKVLQRFFSNRQAKEMCKHVRGLNWPTFRQTLRKMTEDLGLSVPRDILGKIVEYRNELVHRMHFFKDSANSCGTKRKEMDPYEAYRAMLDYVGKLLLAILRYEGYYLDWTKSADWEDQMMSLLHIGVTKGNWPTL